MHLREFAAAAGLTASLSLPVFAQCPPETLVGSDTATGDKFGIALAISGDAAIVGAAHDIAVGKAYVFERSQDSDWLETAALTPTLPVVGPDSFGRSVDVAGTIAAVGAPEYDASNGRVYVYERVGTDWLEMDVLSSGLANSVLFGRCVVIHDDQILVGRPQGTPSTLHGIHVFERSGQSWTEVDMLEPAEDTAFFGGSIAADGSTMIVGATESVLGFTSTGSAFIFERIGGQWIQQQRLTASDGVISDSFGYHVGISGDTAMVSAPWADGSHGKVYVFQRDGLSGDWSEVQILTIPTPDSFGQGFSLDGNVAYIGAANNDDIGQNSGAVHRFVRNAGTWGIAETFYPNPGLNQRFGFAVAGNDNAWLAGSTTQDYAIIRYAQIGSLYCDVNPNSTGLPARIVARGQCSAAENDLLLGATQLPPNRFGYFLLSESQGFFPNPGGSDGNLCLGGTIGRFQAQVQNSGPAGAIAIDVDLTNVPLFGTIFAGDTWNFTCWYRDVGGASNFTGGVQVPFN